MRITVKIGTQSILSEKGAPMMEVLAPLTGQLTQLQKNGHKVILVSSGAVGLGRKSARDILGKEYGNTIGEKQLLASMGQHEMMRVYAGLFGKHRIAVSQLLLTKQDFHTRRNYMNIMRLLEEILSNKDVIPIINENDTVAVEELMFTDNDELSELIATQTNADKLIILSNVEGVYTGNPNDEGSELIPVINPDNGWPDVSTVKSAQGRGGMASKLKTARKASSMGITTHIAKASCPDVITRIVAGEQIGTLILPQKKKSNIKKWIAHAEGHSGAYITVNKRLEGILEERNKIMSILPVGLVDCSEDFKKGEILNIMSPKGNLIGIGIARYSGKELREILGQKNQPEIVHYDYLYIF